MASIGGKPSLQMYRDIMRLIKHMAGTSSPKASQLKQIVTTQFRVNRHVTDPAQLHQLKQMAERGLSNYLIFQTSKTDPKIAAYAAEADRFEDDAEGQLVKVANAPVQQKARVTLRKATAAGGAGAGGERKQ